MKPPTFPQVIAKGNSRVTIYRHTNAKAGASYDEFNPNSEIEKGSPCGRGCGHGD